MTVHVQCNNCGAWGLTDNHGDPDSAVRCVTDAGDPPGSVDGSCCTACHTHDEHAQYAREQHDDGSLCRTVTITIMPGGVQVSGAGGAAG